LAGSAIKDLVYGVGFFMMIATSLVDPWPMALAKPPAIS
jgi:hypothetical protein